MAGRSGITPLCEMGYKWGTDKCPQLRHYYTPYYYELFENKREAVKKVLEMGVGTYKDMQHVESVFDRGLNRHYHRGASLYMWRDFFPNAQIYGADYAREAMFIDGRIETFLCDERKEEDLLRLIEQTGSDIDLFVDDGSHKWQNQAFLCQTVLPLLDRGVIYVIEDVGWPDHLRRELSGFVCHVPNIPHKWSKSRLMLVRRK